MRHSRPRRDRLVGDSDHIVLAIRGLTRQIVESLQGRGLDGAEVAYYSRNQGAWHEVAFHVLMRAVCDLRSLHREALEIIFANATRVPADDLAQALKTAGSLDADLQRCADCWEADKDLAYEQFGGGFIFGPPRHFPGRQGP